MKSSVFFLIKLSSYLIQRIAAHLTPKLFYSIISYALYSGWEQQELVHKFANVTLWELLYWSNKFPLLNINRLNAQWRIPFQIFSISWASYFDIFYIILLFLSTWIMNSSLEFKSILLHILLGFIFFISINNIRAK